MSPTRLICLLIAALPWCPAPAAEPHGTVAVRPRTEALPPDSTASTRTGSRHQLRNPFLNRVYEVLKEFSRIDTTYIEPQHYNYAVMLQNTNTYEVYHLRNRSGQEVVFAPRPSYKVGPYFGWRWIFLGYTFDVAHIAQAEGKQDFNISLYSNQIGLDLFYRKSGKSYRVRRLALGNDYDTSPLKGAPFGGFHTSVKGGNLYYIFNHKRFSYPAAYSQSTVQRRSAGSAIAGIGYTRHKLNVDWEAFEAMARERMGDPAMPTVLDTAMMASEVVYDDYSLSGGYAYNWVFAHNWLFDVSLQGALAYKRTKGDTSVSTSGFLRSFDVRNFNLDGILRMGVVWNDTRWFAGANAIFHTYNYKKAQFSTNNIFGSVNFYVGLNFGKR